MRFEDPTPDQEIGDALRSVQARASLSPWELNVVARRVIAHAAPLLERKRTGVPPWWQYPAVWARTLIPLGLTTALAAIAGFMWATLEPLPLPVERLAMDPASATLSEDVLSQGLLDALNAPAQATAGRSVRENK